MLENKSKAVEQRTAGEQKKSWRKDQLYCFCQALLLIYDISTVFQLLLYSFALVLQLYCCFPTLLLFYSFATVLQL
jgi:ATP-dependent protease HslVU (ClpYQ) peptidase subunit